MRKTLSIAAALLFVATGAAFARGGDSDRGDTNPYVAGKSQIQVETASQTADAAGGTVESLR